LERLTYINTIPVRVFEHKRPQPVILILEALDDPRPMLHASGVQPVDIVHHQVGNRERGGWVVGLQGQMQLALVALQNHEADRVSIFEGFRKPQDPGVKIMGPAHVLYGKRYCNSSETDAMINDCAHRRTSTCKHHDTCQAVLVSVKRLAKPEGAGRCLRGRGYFA
jgi:hypothetical protein